jgi:hypothetical protein
MQVSSTKLSKGKRRPKEPQEERGTQKNKEWKRQENQSEFYYTTLTELKSTPLLGRIHIYEIAEEILHQHLEGNTTKGVQ